MLASHYNYFRDYGPSTGRYAESDPIGQRGGLNTYAYVGGNPLGAIDPFGLAPMWKKGNGFTDVPDGPGWQRYIPGDGVQPEPPVPGEPKPGKTPDWPGHIELPSRIPPDNLCYPPDAPVSRWPNSRCLAKCKLASIGNFIVKEFTLDFIYDDAIPEVASSAAKNNSPGQRILYKGLGAGSKVVGKGLLVKGAWQLGADDMRMCEIVCTE